jgi:hypothetical protein
LKSILDRDRAVTSKGYFAKRKDAEVYRLEYGGNNQSQLFQEWLYKDASVYLSRKHEIFAKSTNN